MQPQRLVGQFTLKLNNSNTSVIQRKKRPSSNADAPTDDQRPAKRQRLERSLSRTSIESGTDTSGYMSSQTTGESDDIQMREQKDQPAIALSSGVDSDGAVEQVDVVMVDVADAPKLRERGLAPITEPERMFFVLFLCVFDFISFQKRNIALT